MLNITAGLITGMASILYEEESFKLSIANLPEDIRKELKAKRRTERKEWLEHQRKIEIAKAGRARNFWGN